MSRPLLFRTTELPYHVTGRCNNREPFPGDRVTTWQIFCEELKRITQVFDSRVHAFVLMPNHFHLMISTPQQDLGITMQSFIARVTQRLNRTNKRCGRIFGAKYFRNVISDSTYLDCVFRYVYQNPVRAGICPRVEYYPFSSIHSLLNPAKADVLLSPVIGYDSLIPNNDAAAYLKWLNIPYSDEQRELIQKAMQEEEFFMPRRLNLEPLF